MASNDHFTNSQFNLPTNSDAIEAGRQEEQPSVTFARRTSSGRYLSYSRDDLDSELESVDLTNYTVQHPHTTMMDPSISHKVEEQYVSSLLFTGGFNSVTRAHLMDKVIDSDTSHRQMAGSYCAVKGCDVKVMSDERGQDVLPCECDFKICRECFVDASGMCPGCKEPYRNTDLTDFKRERRLSLIKSTESGLTTSLTEDFDHNMWLFGTNGTFGFGTAFGNFRSEKDRRI